MATMDEIEQAIIESWNHFGAGLLDPYWADDGVYDAGGPALGRHKQGKAEFVFAEKRG